ncbi:MAG: formylglycine-generating enzyme family protein, partial [Chloroflexi bacterium]|nr:formylglycine-generating enzyme family protein [Chloroflexota bacterium]
MEIPGGKFTYRNGESLTLPTFSIARYPITYRQFQAFIDADDGSHNPEWWHGLAADAEHKAALGDQAFRYWSHPRERVSWYDTVAFCRWLSHESGDAITLPTEQQWQWAAQNGLERRDYPCGDWDRRRCNTNESGIRRSTAVGMYPHGVAVCGALDLSGNLWEWYLNKRVMPNVIVVDDSGDWRVLRGGSWGSDGGASRTVYRRHDFHPAERDGGVGFRVVRPPS